ncbi:MAG: V protein [Nevskiaceae bacterium]|nr:MAG: V protein [Nevskiaceae bacterium]TAM31414.1 MAG: V protein [Nevskiaceae bacterium]
MIKIEVISSSVKQVVKKATGEVFNIPEVAAYAHDLEKYPVPIKFGVAKGQQPPAPGFYILDSSSFYVGAFGQLMLKSSLVLKPVTEALKRAA